MTATPGYAAPLSAAGARLVGGLESRTVETARDATHAIFDEIPAYAASHSERFFSDVCQHVERNIATLICTLRRGGPPTEEELVFLRAPTARRAQHEIALDEFLHAFRIGLRHIWRSLVRDADDDESRAVALTLVDPVAEYINIASTRVAEVYLEVEQLLLAEGERVRRDVLEDLLGAAGVRPGPRAEALGAAGLSTGASFVVVSALADRRMEPSTLRTAATAIGRVVARNTAPLAVQRGDEIVAVLPVGPGCGRAVADALDALRARLAAEDMPLRIGVSTIVTGLVQAPAAYREACVARAMSSEARHVMCLCGITAFDYLTLTGDGTAARMVAPEIAAFVAEDLAAGGVLTDTLLAYAAADLNVKLTAERLFVHVNTAHKRLARIAERSGRDLRRLNDVIELLIAIKLAAAAAGRSSG
ncbi:hypothetical protein DSM112329_00762 [Paraconexibacter sp. AEG42_29]|uniref:PucR family transcriptional regulator n=1 Tax=Paraconexibacter sp. AEG42_29 TaxID=2997339 RepID=A0AAU7AR13_9ACTN